MKATGKVATRLLLAAASLLFSLAMLEWAARTLLVRSQDFAPTLASQRWMERHWKPVNRFGVRDREWDPEALAKTRTVLVVGDSFAAGQGIRDPDARIGPRLAERLGSGWSVLSVAQPGWETAQQLDALARIEGIPIRPDAVVLVYFVNDVLGAAARFGLGLDLEARLAVRPAWLEPGVRHSHLVNFAYWRLWRQTHQAELGRAYRELLELGFYRHEVWQAHRQELGAMLAWARRHEAPFVAVVVPILVDVEGSRKYTSRVVRFFESEGVPVIDLAAHLAGRDPHALIVSEENHHANEALHAEMAERVERALQRLPVSVGP